MSNWENNFYYSPEKSNLEILASIDFSDGNYCFDYRVIWREITTGKLYTARDSGCSCPSPFEDFNTLEDLDEFVASKLIKEIKEELKDSYVKVSVNEANDFIAKIKSIEKEHRRGKEGRD